MTKADSFESQLAKLEKIVQQMDGEDLSLEKTIDLYEQGVQLSQKLNLKLTQAQQKIEILSKTEESDELQAQPFEGDHD